MSAVSFRKATSADWPAVAQLLQAAELPLDGAEGQILGFVLAHAGDGELVGAAAVEPYGDAALLRSVAVAKGNRGAGLGHDLVLRTLESAYADGVRTVVLLTTTAEHFFPRFGFRRVDRSAVPAAVTASAEFQGACPASAAVMMLKLKAPPVLVRPARPEDAAEIARIYNQGIEDRSTLETQLRSPDERLGWLTARGPRHPVTVAERGGKVIGWASLNPFSTREAYRWVADLSVYIERSERGTGIGTILMADLTERARRLDYHKLVLTTFPTLTGAVTLYERLGFRHVGDYREQGMLDGDWVDTRIMELVL